MSKNPFGEEEEEEEIMIEDMEEEEGREDNILASVEHDIVDTGRRVLPSDIKYPQALERAIAQVHPSDDPLDSPDFDPTDFVNRVFPNEQSLANIDAFVARLHVQIRRADEEILDAVRAQSSSSTRGKEELKNAQVAVRELLERVRHIRAKAEQSEVMVQEICRDIKSLDYAKRHLTTAITALKRLHMLVSAVDQLGAMTSKGQYRDAANLLEATGQLLTHFAGHASDPRLVELRSAVDAVRSDLRRRVFEDFSRAMGGAEDDPLETHPYLPDASLVAAALGRDCRDELVMWFCSTRVAAYRSHFRPGTEAAGIGHVDRRFAHIRRAVRSTSSMLVARGVFPKGWHVPHRLAADLCAATREELSGQLKAMGDGTDVQVLVRCMQKTIEFEAELERDYGTGDTSRRHRPSTDNNDNDNGDEDSNENDNDPNGNANGDSSDEEEIGTGDPEADAVAAIKAKYRRMFKQRQREEREREEAAQRARTASEAGTDGNNNNSNGNSGKNGSSAGVSANAHVESDAPEPVRFKGIISSCFEPYMSVYISHEDRTMRELVERLGREEQWVPSEDVTLTRGQVLGSSTDLFLYIRSSMKRCVSLSRAQPFADLTRVYRTHLRAYADLLASKLPSVPTAQSFENGKGGVLSRAPAAPAGDWQLLLTPSEETGVGMIISTAEYCFDTVDQLSSTIRKNMAKGKGLRDDVDLSAEQDEFNAVLNRGVRTLVASLETRLAPALAEMNALKLSSLEHAGDQSDYVTLIMRVLSERVPVYARTVSAPYFKFFVDKFISSFVPKYIAAIHKCRRVSDTGAQQLLVDAHAVKTAIMGIPGLGNQGEAGLEPGTRATLNDSTAKYLNREFSKAEALLKVLQTPTEGLVDSYAAMVAEPSQAGFQKVLELKGLKKSEQQALMDQYTRSMALSGRTEASAAEQPSDTASQVRPSPERSGGRGPRAQALKKLFNLSWAGKGSPGGGEKSGGL